MKILYFTLIAIHFSLASMSQGAPPSPEIQIKGALLAAPDDKKEGAMVYGYSEKGELTVLRKGSNEFVCLADDPAQASFSVACYHRELEPFMARGRELKKQGKNVKEVFDTREAEVKSGKLKMPKQPTSLFVYTASNENYNRLTGEITDGYIRSVVYIPYATPESTGIPLKPAGAGMPWLMHPGTHGAHIMINPAKAK